MKMIFGKNLAIYRKKANLTKQDLANRLKVHWNTVHRWEKGELFPRPELLEEIAKILNVEISDLLKAPEPEPFPGFDNIMCQPARERYYSVWQLAAQHAGIQVALGAMGDPLFRDRIPKLETEEEVIEAYKEALSYWKKVTKRLDEELRKRGIRVESEEEMITVPEEDLKSLDKGSDK
ncbi:helix-turn-helix domain protein [Thermodesulfatator indicus DSM 15286]|uniref:Helix-turn-helix domain protein n=1 Tax=Thermodesulfatator indicus (strain DSM 15286 / JCM 11887 / CIR29812) TaxID=667014 RepID=F8ACP7_THEID|nr:helix-turn-helix transcriptional regulator [Thermodesulfatator indicus]AEH45826.1 helix-turn-helix domain protein [Thermodesulfatator indicus DSM 15286]